MDFFKREARRHFPRYWPDASSFEVVSRDVRFTRGALYDVGPESQYGELEFSGELKIRVTTSKPVSTVSYASGPGSFFSTATPITPEDALVGVSRLGLHNLFLPRESEAAWKTVSLGAGKTNQLLSMSSLLNAPTYSIPVETTTHDFSLSGALIISMRLVSGKVTNLGFEKIELGEPSRL